MLSSVYLVALFIPMSGLCVLRNCKEALTGTSGLFLTLGKTPDHSSPSLQQSAKDTNVNLEVTVHIPLRAHRYLEATSLVTSLSSHLGYQTRCHIISVFELK